MKTAVIIRDNCIWIVVSSRTPYSWLGFSSALNLRLLGVQNGKSTHRRQGHFFVHLFVCFTVKASCKLLVTQEKTFRITTNGAWTQLGLCYVQQEISGLDVFPTHLLFHFHRALLSLVVPGTLWHSYSYSCYSYSCTITFCFFANRIKINGAFLQAPCSVFCTPLLTLSGEHSWTPFCNLPPPFIHSIKNGDVKSTMVCRDFYWRDERRNEKKSEREDKKFWKGAYAPGKVFRLLDNIRKEHILKWMRSLHPQKLLCQCLFHRAILSDRSGVC